MHEHAVFYLLCRLSILLEEVRPDQRGLSVLAQLHGQNNPAPEGPANVLSANTFPNLILCIRDVQRIIQPLCLHCPESNWPAV